MKNDENPEIPNGIGPHEGREFALMRENKKNVALFFEIEPDGLNEILQEGYCLLQFRQFVHLGQTFFTRIVFRDGFETDAIRLKTLVSETGKDVDPTREYEIGTILSYSREQVEAFIQHSSQSDENLGS